MVFKQTDAGAIPEDWEVRTIGESLQFISGKAHEQYVSRSGEFVVVNSKFISTDGAVRKHCTVNLTPAREGDVLMVMSDLPNGRALAKCFLVEESNKYAVNQRVCIFRSKSHDPRYLKYILNRNTYFMAFDDGVQQTHLLNETIRKCPIALPSRNEQRAIADALTSVNDVISTLERLIAKKRSIKQSMMQQLLTGKTRLPGFTAPWTETKLRDVLSFQVGFPFKSEFFNDTPVGVRLVRNRDLKSNGSPIYYSGNFMDSYLVSSGDVLVGMDGDFTPCLWQSGRALLNQRIGRIRPIKCVPEFMLFALQQPLIDLEASTGATTVKHLSHKDVESLVLHLPTIDEQNAIAQALMAADNEINRLQIRFRKAQYMKTGMVQELLTGRTRLPIGEVPA
ncbi:hypothetical protein BH686_04200 [Rhodococcus erythropolis]|nr:hypothetical protein BH686_04200 [Rhodococcus erythropolis]